MRASPLAAERQALDELIDGVTLVDVLARNVAEAPDDVAISWRAGGESRDLTWQQFSESVWRVAAGMIAAGIEPGDTVAVMMGNRPEHVIADLAAVHAGAIPISVYETLAPAQVAYVTGNAQVKAAIFEADRTAVWRDTPVPIKLTLEDDWDALVAHDRSPAVADRAAAVDADSIATLIYTSGTTGDPKGVVITQRNVLWTLAAMGQALDLPARPRLVSYLPLAHIAERIASHYLGLWLLGHVTYCATPAAIMNVVRGARPHLFVGVPRIWETLHQRVETRLAGLDDRRRQQAIAAARAAQAALLDHPNPATAVLARMADRLVLRKVRAELGLDEARLAITTAGPIQPEVIRSLRTLGLPLHELFGMTECTGPATTNLPGNDRIGSVGRSLAGVEVTTAPDGELLIRGGNVAAGYHRADEATAATFDADGWLRTGDLAEIDDEGYVTITGRKKDIIVTASGKNVAPASLELALSAHPMVAHACVVGDRRPFLVAVLALDPENTEGLASDEVVAEIEQHVARVNESVSHVEQIRKYVVVEEHWSPESGEVTPSLKLRRRIVIDRYADIIEGLYPSR